MPPKTANALSWSFWKPAIYDKGIVLTRSRSPGKRSSTTTNGGSVENSAEPRFVIIGRITKPHGIRGEVCVIPLTDLPERFKWLEYVYIGNKNPLRVPVESVRYHGQSILLKLEGYPTRDEAEQLRDLYLRVPEEEAIPLEGGEYFLFQTIGLEVYTEDGARLGIVTDILETGANNVFVVDGPSGELFIPDIVDVILDVDIVSGRLLIHPIPGLLDG